MKDCKACSGCYNDFYNDHNPYGVKQCWSVPSAKIVTRFRLHRDTPMWHREAYANVKLPNCYHRSGYVFLDAIPDYAKTPKERAVIEQREAERAALETKATA